MTTATRPKSPRAGLERLDAAVHKARQERDRIRREAATHTARLAALDAELGDIARRDAAQFDGGQPREGTRAAAIRDEIRTAQEGSRWADLAAGAEQAVTEAVAAATRYRDAHAVELATELFRTGEGLVAQLSSTAEAGLAILSQLDGLNAELAGIVASCRGRIDGRDVVLDPRLAELRRLLVDHGSFRGPRSRTLTPLPNESPPVVRGRDGGWVRASHGSDSHDAAQPPRVEPAR